MSNLPEISSFDDGVYQLELTDPVIGGPSGVSNLPLKNLANRTKYLKDHVDLLEAAQENTITSVTGDGPISSTGGKTPKISIAPATPTVHGSMSAADKSKLNAIEAGAQVNEVVSIDGAKGLITLGALASFAKTFGASGYQKLPSGLIIQWGSYTAGASGAVYQFFPIAFPNGCFNVSVTGISESVTATDIFGVGAISAVNFLVYGSNNADGAATMRFYWLAIGY